MSPSNNHEEIAWIISRLVEAYCEERKIQMWGFRSFTHKDKSKKAGLEPDECYIFGDRPAKVVRSDLAIEVVWTSGGIKKLDVYLRLGVREVWIWKNDAISIYCLTGDEYELADRSQFVPDIDLALICKMIPLGAGTPTIQKYRSILRGESSL